MKRFPLQITVFAILAAVALPAQAGAASPAQILRDCLNDEIIDGSYSDADLQRARNNLRGDADEYSNCGAIIGAAIGGGPSAKSASNEGDGGGGDDGAGGIAGVGGPGIDTARERRAAAEQRAERDERRQLASLGDDIGAPGATSALPGAEETDNGLPLPLALALIALACLGIAGGVWYAGQHNETVASAIRRVPNPLRRG